MQAGTCITDDFFFAFEQIDVMTVLEIVLLHQNILIYFGPFILKLNALWTMFCGHSKIVKFDMVFAPLPHMTQTLYKQIDES